MQDSTRPIFYTLGQAAIATGKRKSTLSDAIKKGRISVMEKDGIKYKIDPAELHRVYPLIEQETKGTQTVKMRHLEAKLDGLDIELYKAKSRLQEKDEQIKQLEEDRDSWRKQATYLLGDKREREQQGDDMRQRLDKETQEKERLSAELAAQQERVRQMEHAEALRQVAAPQAKGIIRRIAGKIW